MVTIAGCTCHTGSPSLEVTLPPEQPAAPQIQAQVSVPKTAPAGESIRFSAIVSVANGNGAPLTGTAGAPTVTVATVPASSSPPAGRKSAAAPGSTPGRPAAGGSTTAGSAVGGSAVTVPSPPGVTSDLGAALPVGALPIVGSDAPGTTINVPAGSAANLFPQITPSTPSTAPSPAPRTGHAADQGQDAVATSSVIPISLTSPQFEAQILGLIVLLFGVAVV
ncbi:MAG TPA: hypothetical protein VIZ20_20735, partial [Streptosporangiaceae bacterium]